MYSYAVATYGRWPTPKKEVAQVDALNLSVLLPDIRPYYKEDDARWKVRGNGDKAEVMIADAGKLARLRARVGTLAEAGSEMNVSGQAGKAASVSASTASHVTRRASP